MGLDIHITANNHNNLPLGELDEYFYKHSLSRTFCNLMCRRDVISHEPELDQIGRITGIDVSIFYEMEDYPEEKSLDLADSKEERQNILSKAKESGTVNGNIDKALNTVSELIIRLNLIDDLPELLLPTNFDSLGNVVYFSDFTVDTGDGYIGNNFGQDLRNFQRFLAFAKEHGTTSVWFEYG